MQSLCRLFFARKVLKERRSAVAAQEEQILSEKNAAMARELETQRFFVARQLNPKNPDDFAILARTVGGISIFLHSDTQMYGILSLSCF